MGNICDCSTGKLNTAPNSCPDLLQITKRIILVPKYKADGTVNEFANKAAVTKAALQAKFDENDIDDRFFPLAEFKNVEETRADSVFQEFNDRSKVKIEDGKRSFTGYIVNQGAKYLQKIKSWGCQEFGVYIIDKNSNFRYKTDKATELKVQPIAVDQNSFEAKLVLATDTTSEMIMVSFDFASYELDEYIRYIAYEDLDFDGLNTSDVYGLYTVTGTATSISTTGVTITLTTDYGLPVKNFLITDFFDSHGGTHSNLYNVTDSAAVPILTFAETSYGVYAMTFAAQTSADVLRCTPDKSKYDFSAVTSVAITIP